MKKKVLLEMIGAFIGDLCNAYGADLKPLRRLNAQVTESATHDQFINIITQFCLTNTSAILERNTSGLIDPIIRLSAREYVDLGLLLEDADEEQSENIWAHLLAISGCLNPKGEAIDVLRQIQNKPAAKRSNEEQCIHSLVGKIQAAIPDDGSVKDPMQAFQSVAQSGAFASLVQSLSGDIESGKINVQSMLGMLGGAGALSNFMPQAAPPVSDKPQLEE